MLKKIGIICFCIINLYSCSNENLNNINAKNNTEIKQNITEIKNNLVSVWVSDFKLEIDKKESILIDLRTYWEVTKGVIKWWAINIDYYASDFKEKLDKLDKNKKYLIYCRSWARSWRALNLMKTLWFKNVLNLSNWINSWIKSDWEIVNFEN
jgi:rhodanese-related sulfurtransferase